MESFDIVLYKRTEIDKHVDEKTTINTSSV